MATSPNPSPSSGPGTQRQYPGAGKPRSNVLLWVLAGLGVMFCCMLLVGIVILRSLAGTRINIDKATGTVEVRTPDGTSIRAGRTGDVGLPVYPGAVSNGRAGGVEIITSDDKHGGVSGAVYDSPDSIEKVDSWYGDRLGKDFNRQGPGHKPVEIRGVNVHIEDGDIAYISDSGTDVSIVSLKPRAGGTEISLARLGGRQAQ